MSSDRYATGRTGGDPYLIPGTDMLENKPGIKDAKELERVERLLTADRLVELTRDPIAGKFDLPHLQRIHRAIFQDVYEWAGDLREINIAKGSIRFAMTGQLESSAAGIFGRLAHDNHLRDPTRNDFANAVSEYLADVNALHPFREGNGRAQREFFRTLASRAGFRLDWSRTNAKEMVRASIAGMVGDSKPFRRMLSRVTLERQSPELDSDRRPRDDAQRPLSTRSRLR